MLATLLKERMARERMSNRDVARQVDVSHTTINRILQGKNADLSTIQKVCDWLGVDMSAAINTEQNSLAAKIAVLIQSNPALEKLFSKAVEDVDAGKLSPSDLQDILSYAAFRLQK